MAVYWQAYGGARALIRSPYVHIALLGTACCFGLWKEAGWWDTVLDIQPSMLGFTLGGFALLLASASDKFGMFLAKAREPEGDAWDAPLAKLAVAFAHFILMQMISIAIALFAKSANMVTPPDSFSFLSSDLVAVSFWGIGFLCFTYALLCSLAATEWVFRSVEWLVRFKKKQFEHESEDN